MEAMRERTLVGLFVLIAAGLLFGTMLAVYGGLGASTVSHRAYFKYAAGVQAGAPVRYGGMTVGRVTRVRIDPGNSTRIEIEWVVSRDTPVKTDSVAKISALGPLTDNYIEVTTGSQQAALAPPGSVLSSQEAFGISQLGDAAASMMPDARKAIDKLNQNLDDLRVTLARANDLLNDRNRANIGGSLDNVNRMLSDGRPKVARSLENLDGMLDDARPKVSASMAHVQEVTEKMSPLLDDVKAATARANDALAHVDSTLLENRDNLKASVASLRDTLAQSAVLVDRLNLSLDQNSPNIDEILDNLRMSTENLRVLTETLKRSPSSLIRGMKVPDRKPGDITH